MTDLSRIELWTPCPACATTGHYREESGRLDPFKVCDVCLESRHLGFLPRLATLGEFMRLAREAT